MRKLVNSCSVGLVKKALSDRAHTLENLINLISPADYDRRLENSLILSVTKHPEVAAGVVFAFEFLNTTQPVFEESKIYLFEAEVDELSIFHLGDQLSFPFIVQKAVALGLTSKYRFPDGFTNSYPFDRDVESFIFFAIPPTSLKNVYEVDPEDSPMFIPGGLNQPVETQRTAEDFISRLRKL
jgi:hypothetical protein